MNNILDGTPIPYASITGLEHQPVSAGISRHWRCVQTMESSHSRNDFFSNR